MNARAAQRFLVGPLLNPTRGLPLGSLDGDGRVCFLPWHADVGSTLSSPPPTCNRTSTLLPGYVMRRTTALQYSTCWLRDQRKFPTWAPRTLEAAPGVAPNAACNGRLHHYGGGGSTVGEKRCWQPGRPSADSRALNNNSPCVSPPVATRQLKVCSSASTAWSRG